MLRQMDRNEDPAKQQPSIGSPKDAKPMPTTADGSHPTAGNDESTSLSLNSASMKPLPEANKTPDSFYNRIDAAPAALPQDDGAIALSVSTARRCLLNSRYFQARSHLFTRRPGYEYLYVRIDYRRKSKFGMTIKTAGQCVLASSIAPDSLCSEKLKVGA